MSMGTTAVMAMHLYEQGCCFKNSLGSSVIPYCLCWDHGKSYTLVRASTPTVLQYAQEVKYTNFTNIIGVNSTFSIMALIEYLPTGYKM